MRFAFAVSKYNSSSMAWNAEKSQRKCKGGDQFEKKRDFAQINGKVHRIYVAVASGLSSILLCHSTCLITIVHSRKILSHADSSFLPVMIHISHKPYILYRFIFQSSIIRRTVRFKHAFSCQIRTKLRPNQQCDWQACHWARLSSPLAGSVHCRYFEVHRLPAHSFRRRFEG